MLWRLTCSAANPESRAEPPNGRYVLHRHHDAGGPHLDLRIEQDGFLTGWRIDATSLDDGPLATGKAPHPLRWLDHNGDAVREDHGLFTWLEPDGNRQRLLLNGNTGNRIVEVMPVEGLPPRAIADIRQTLDACAVPPEAASAIIRDGVEARRRAIGRLCGLARELDGPAFDETAWKAALAGRTLDEIHGFLRAYEVRFDRAYPPRPVSQPEPLPGTTQDGRDNAILSILRE